MGLASVVQMCRLSCCQTDFLVFDGDLLLMNIYIYLEP